MGVLLWFPFSAQYMGTCESIAVIKVGLRLQERIVDRSVRRVHDISRDVMP